MLAALGVVLLAALIVAATFFWLGRRDAAVNGPPELIQAQPGPYKVKPPNPGGLDITGESETAFETSAGEDKDAQLDLSKVPEAPVAKPRAAQPVRSLLPANRDEGPRGSAARAAASSRRARPEASFSSAPLPTRRRPSGRGPRCRRVSRASPRMNKLIIPFSGGIRLRAGAASSADAKQACQTLKAAGENCFVAQ